MEIVASIFSNLTMFLVAQTIFVQQDFRTINCLFEENQSELSNKILQIANKSLKPVRHFLLDKSNIKKSRFAGPTLNVVVLDDINIPNNIRLVREIIFSDDVTLILQNDYKDINKGINSERLNTLSAKVIILTKSHLIFLNEFENSIITDLDFSGFNPILTQKSIQTYLSSTQTLRPAKNFTIFFQFSPPKSGVAPIGKKFILIGPDGSLAQSLANSLKVKPIFSTDIGLTYPNYEKWLDDPVISSRIHYQFYYTKVLTKNVVTIFNKSITDNMHLHLSPYTLKERLLEEKMQLKTENLYPHEKDCLVVMVPKQSSLEQFLRKIVRNSDIQSIFIALTLFIIVRIIIERPTWKHWINIFIKTLGIFLNQDKIRNENEVEVAWDINLRGFSVLATITLSVIIYKNLVSKQYMEIDTIEDLIASNLTIFAPEFLQNDDTFWSNLKPILQKKINFKGIDDINHGIVMERKFNYAYIFMDSAAEYMEMLLHTYTPTGTNYKRTVRIMNEKLYCILSSYRISKNSQLKGYVNDFIRRFIESGLYDRHLEWIRRLNRDVFQVNKYLNKHKQTSDTDPVILNMDMVFDIFVLYSVGIAASIIIFVFEIKM